ncbi:metallophosphoesterase [Paenibacillus sp. 1P07SE]|uniref:metallophosphoesterase n=1 Tax=Paenibacillus sp. 1P07SE TaxID=3132209 RepID=UPI0039A57F94
MKQLTRREFIRLALGGLATAAVGTPLYAHYIERRWLHTDSLTLPLPDLPASFDGFRIMHFSDIHLGFHYDVSDLERLVDTILTHEIDLLCFTGDLLEDGLELLEASIPVLSRLQAPFGKVAVLGNHDYWQRPDLVTDALGRAGFQVLHNAAHRIEGEDGAISLIGLEDVMHADPDPAAALAGTQDGDYIIMLVHEPDYADSYGDNLGVRLQLSGHSHGGQIRLPWFGHLITPPLGGRYVDRLNYRGRLPVYTNRGVGTTGVPFRMFCRPELSLIQLVRG